MKTPIPNLLSIGRNTKGDVYIEPLGGWLPSATAVNATAWLNLMMSKEHAQVAGLMAQILGEDSGKAAPAVAEASPSSLALLNIRLELEKLVTRSKTAPMHQRPGTSAREYQDGFTAGLERALGLLAGADGRTSNFELPTSNLEPKKPTPL